MFKSHKLSSQAKRRHAGGRRRSTGATEQPTTSLKAQEVGELLGQAMANCRETMTTGWKNQEAWSITIHGTEVRILTAFFTEQYLKYVNGPFMYLSEKLVVFRSVPLI